jgi:hypothetical protein
MSWQSCELLFSAPQESTGSQPKAQKRRLEQPQRQVGPVCRVLDCHFYISQLWLIDLKNLPDLKLPRERSPPLQNKWEETEVAGSLRPHLDG